MSKFIKNFTIILISITILGSSAIFGVLWTFSNNIPDYKFLKNYKPPVSSKVYSGNGELVSDFSKEKRIFVPFNILLIFVIIIFINKFLILIINYNLNALR